MSEIKQTEEVINNRFRGKPDLASDFAWKNEFKRERNELRAAYEALKAENKEHKATISNLTKAYERESNDCLKALEERDYWYDKADSLADKISECFDVPIGEHSNVNCPIDEANKILDGEYVTKFDKQVEALKAENEALRKKVEELSVTTGMQHLDIANLKSALSAYGDPDVLADNED